MRLGLALASIVAFLAGAVWWFWTGMLASSYDSACVDSATADVAFGAAVAGVGLSLVAFVAAVARAPRYAASALGAYLVLLVLSAALAATCE